MSTKKLINAYLLVKILESVSIGWFFGTYVLFLLEKGLTPAQATQVNMAYMLINFFFDLPTGAIADMFGQVPVYLIGVLILSGGFFAYGLGSTFTFFVVCEGLSAVGSALMSEALEALLTNEVGIEKSKEVQAREGVYAKLATIPSALLGTFIGSYFGLQYPWFLSGATCFVGFVVGIIVLRGHHFKPKRTTSGILDTFVKFFATVKTGTSAIFHRKHVVFALTITLILAASTQAMNMFWAPVLKEQAGSSWWLGFLWAGMAITTAFGAWLSKNLAVKLSTIALLVVSIGIPIILTNVFPPVAWITSLLFLAHEIGRGAMPVVMYAYVNRHIQNECRSTANSAIGSMDKLARWVGLFLAGTLTLSFTMLQTWLIFGIVLLVTGVFALGVSFYAES